MKTVKYRVEMPRHGVGRDTVTLRHAQWLCRLELRDGWTSHVLRLVDNVVVFPTAPRPRGQES